MEKFEKIKNIFKTKFKTRRENSNRKIQILITIIFSCILLYFFNSFAYAESNIASNVLSLLTTGLIAIFFWKYLLIALAILITLHLLLTAIGALVLNTGAGPFLTPADIFFNRVALTNIDFYDFSSRTSSTVLGIRNTVASWFGVINSIAMVLMLLVLIYIAIRIILSTNTEKIALYKSALSDWLYSVSLLFLLQVYAVVLIKFTNAILFALEKGVVNNQNILSETDYSKIFLEHFDHIIAMIIIHGMILRYTFIFFLQYVKRMIKVAFLILISPLIAVSYALDKVKDKTSQALQNWMKTFTQEVVIQPFHALIYILLLNLAEGIMNESGTLVAGLIAIIIFKFIVEAEGLIKQIFGVSSGTTVKDNSSLLNQYLGMKALEKYSKVLKENPLPKAISSRFSNIDRTSEVVGVPDTNNLNNTNNKNNINDTELENETVLVNNNVNTDVEDHQEALVAEAAAERQAIDDATPVNQLKPGKSQKGNLTLQNNQSNNNGEEKEKKDSLLTKYKRTLKTLDNYNLTGILLGAAWEAADPKDTLLTNLIQGGAGGAIASGVLKKKVLNSMDKKKVKKYQENTYEKHVKDAAKELNSTVENYSALTDMNFDNTTDQGRMLLKKFFDDIENKMNNGNALEKTYFANKQKLVDHYRKNGKSRFESEFLVDEMETEFLTAGKNVNVNKYNMEEKEFLTSMLEFKIAEDRKEVESVTGLVNPNAYKEVQARMLNGTTMTQDPDSIKETSDNNTYDDLVNKYVSSDYLDGIRAKNQQMETLLSEIEKEKQKLEEIESKSKSELDTEVHDNFNNNIKDFEDYIKSSKTKIQQNIKNIEQTLSKEYKLKNPKLEKAQYTANTKNVDKFIADKNTP